jgi:hypothetical protein
MIWTRRYYRDEWEVNMEGPGPDDGVDYWTHAVELSKSGRWRVYKFLHGGPTVPSQSLPANWTG